MALLDEQIVLDNSEKSVMDQNVDYVVSQFLSGFLPPPDMDIAEWAEKYRVLPKSSASEHGQWHNDRTPYLVEIMRELSPQSMAEEVAFMKPVQVGGTELLINFVLYTMMYDPCPIGVFEPDEMLTRKLMNRITAAAKEMGLDRYFTAETMYEKTFPGGQLYAGWSSSESHLRSAPMKKVAGDETGSWVEDCEGFGDPVGLMRDRTTTFGQKKIFTCSTPGVNVPEKNSFCRMYSRYILGDQRVFKVPCPHCGVYHEFRWSNDDREGEPEFYLKFDKDSDGNELPETARMVCPSCDKSFSESYKDEILPLGQWFKTNPAGTFPSFRLNAFYSPLGWMSWKKIAKDVIEAKKSKSKALMRRVVNNLFGEPFVEVEEERIETTGLMNRLEYYGAEVPDGVICLTGSWDTQDNRVECEIRGWGRNRENWAIAKQIFVGNPQDSTDITWQRLDEFLSRPFYKEDGTKMYVACALGDAMGHCTDAVYSFTGPRKTRRIYACEGHSDRSKSFTSLPKKTDKSRKHSAELVRVCVDVAKDLLFSWIKNERPGTPGYMHFPNTPEYNDLHFKQLGAEKLVVQVRNGKTAYKYVKCSERNEAIDLFDYQLAALDLMHIDLNALNRFADSGKVISVDPSINTMPRQKQRPRQLSRGMSV